MVDLQEQQESRMKDSRIVCKTLGKEDYIISYYMTEAENKPYLAFFNGIFHGVKTWRNQTKSKNLTRDYNFIFFDYQGEGDSTCGKDISFMKMPEDLKDILIKENISSVDIIGYSLGGMFASAFADEYSSMVNKLILINTSYALSESARWMLDHVHTGLKENKPLESVFSSIYPLFFSEAYLNKIQGFEHIILKEYSEYNSNKNDLLRMLQAVRLKPDLKSILGRIKIPVLFITGEGDKIFPVEKQIEASSSITELEHKIYPNGSHSVFIEEHSIVNNEIHSFLVKEHV